MPKVVVTDEQGLVQQTGSGFVINNNTSTTPSYIVLTSADGTEYFLHVANDGEALVLSTSIPTADETSGGTDTKAAFS